MSAKSARIQAIAAVLDAHCQVEKDPATGQVSCACGWFGAFGHFPMHQALSLDGPDA